ncbi:MAG: class I SAM-dependent methyltransferase, partial [Lachnospiraceae bacterium]|nr:class I SAM-dependent methyltransferase [Lachnospiraceae bacterium]
GRDLYSDGEVEEVLLDIAKNHSPEEFNRIIAEKESWAVLYHFSHVRQNIVEWLPIQKTDRVLEVGAGCGAITGMLADKAKDVTCIDLSRMRSHINAYRNREKDNMQILVGNFQDIARDLKPEYDYITLIGVFEYADGYIGGETPYVDMLRQISGLLAPGGKIVIAIENRLGLKYWAGCTEDHVGTFFEGLEGYPNTHGIRTFSKKELLEMFQQAGDLHSRFYYPYPDYKLPMAVYSDSFLPKRGELTNDPRNLDRVRIDLFNEARVYDTLIENELFPAFSNSFLAVLEKEEMPEEQVLYTKYSNERSRKYAITTKIIRQEQGRMVRKEACYPEGNTHVQRLTEWYQALSKVYRGTKLCMNRCAGTDAYADFEYLEGHTLEEELDQLVAQAEKEAFREKMLDYLQLIEGAGVERMFTRTAEFEAVFGRAELPEGLRSAVVTDVDMVCNNVLITGDDRWTLIDYEWTCTFPVPVHFVLYRVIHYYTMKNAKPQWVYDMDLYGEMGITKEEQAVYAEMEQHFQHYMKQEHVSIPDMYQAISPGTININRLQEQIIHLQHKNDVLADRVAYKDEVIRQMENTKVWKLYRKIKKK